MRWQLRRLKCDGLAWNGVIDKVAEQLRFRARSSNRVVILAMNHYLRFVQFRTDAAQGTVRCETISNHFFTQSDRLPRSMIAALTGLGWKPPRPRERHFWRVYPARTTPHYPAAFAVRTLRDVFGASSPASLHVSCAVGSVGVGARAASAESAHRSPDPPEGRTGYQSGDRAWISGRQEAGSGRIWRGVPRHTNAGSAEISGKALSQDCGASEGVASRGVLRAASRGRAAGDRCLRFICRRRRLASPGKPTALLPRDRTGRTWRPRQLPASPPKRVVRGAGM